MCGAAQVRRGSEPDTAPGERTTSVRGSAAQGRQRQAPDAWSAPSCCAQKHYSTLFEAALKQGESSAAVFNQVRACRAHVRAWAEL